MEFPDGERTSVVLDFDAWSVTVTVYPLRAYEERDGALVSWQTETWLGSWMTTDGITGTVTSDDPEEILGYALDHIERRRKLWQSEDGSPH